MEKFANMQSATDYLYNYVKELNPTVEKDDIYDTLLDEIMESAEFVLTDDDIRYLEDNMDNQELTDNYLKTKIPDYEELLGEIVTDMISDEIIEKE